MPSKTVQYEQASITVAQSRASKTVQQVQASKTVQAAVAVNDLVAPTSLTSVANGDTQIDLAWTDNSTTETGYSIERSADGATGWVEIDTVAAGATVYSDTGLTPLDQWYYRVRAYKDGPLYSGYSNEDDTTLPFSAPTGLTATLDGVDIDLVWTDNSGGEDGYSIERSTDGSSDWAEIDTVGAGVTAYTDLDPGGGTWYYRVRAYITGPQYSGYSNTDSATIASALDDFVDYLINTKGADEVWILNEQSGSVAVAQVVSPGRDATYNGQVLADSSDSPVAGDATAFPYNDGANDYIDHYTASLSSLWDGAAGSMFGCFKLKTVSAFDHLAFFGVDGNNFVQLRMLTGPETLQARYAAGGSTKSMSYAATLGGGGWFDVGVWWDQPGSDSGALVVDGTERATMATLGTWVGSLSSSDSVVGARSTAGNAPMDGWMALIAFKFGASHWVSADFADIYNERV